MSIFLSSILALIVAAEEAPPPDDVQTYSLREKAEVGGQVHTKLHLVVRGSLRVNKEDEELAGQALLEYGERVLEVGKDGLPHRMIRYYTDGRAKFVVGNTGDPRRLRPEIRFMVGERNEQALELWSPGGPLMSDERELIEDTMDTTRLAGLLPQHEVAVGDTWEPNADVVLGVCDLDNFIESTIQCKLVSVDGDKAKIEVRGTTNGLALSTEVKQQVEATMVYNLESKMIEEVTWAQADNRGPSPVSPAGSFQVKVSITRERKEVEQLSDAAIAGLSLIQNPASKLLVFQDPEGNYRFFHDRNWHLTMLSSNRAVFRRLAAGQFLCQLNVTTMNELPNREKLTSRDLEKMIETGSGIEIEEVVRVENLPTDGTFDLQLLSAHGKSNAIELEQRHYIATGKTGKQIVFSFSIEPQHIASMGTLDLSMVTSVEFPSNTAGKFEAVTK